jgi:hypothetical protein
MKVFVRNVITKQIQELRQTGGGYTTDRLIAGKYEFLACDDGLTYEPTSQEMTLHENESRRLTLVVGDQRRPVPVTGVAAGGKVCVKHLLTGCQATREIDSDRKIVLRGLQEDYQVTLGACKSER